MSTPQFDVEKARLWAADESVDSRNLRHKLNQACDEIDRLRSQLAQADKLAERMAKMEDALRWYAQRRHYEYDFETGCPVWIDNGRRARAALAPAVHSSEPAPKCLWCGKEYCRDH